MSANPAHSSVLSLASGYGSFAPPQVATEAAVRALQAGSLPLLDAAGLPQLREALAGVHSSLGGGSVAPEQVVVMPGTKAALFALLRTVLRPHDEVLLPTPNWFGFWELITQAGGTVRELPLSPESGYALDPEQLRAALTPRTRVVLFSNPNNPTGRVYSRAEVEAWLTVTREYPELFVLSDEIYNGISFGPEPPPTLLSFPDPHGQHLVVNGFSKSLALIGWGLGYLIAPPATARACAAWQHATGNAVPAPLQHAALAVTQHAPTIARNLVNQLQPTRRLMLSALADLPLVPPLQPEATYYAFPDLRAYLRPKAEPIVASQELVAHLQAAGLTVVDGATCSAPGFVRLSYAVPEQVLQEALARLRQALSTLPY
ncbi:aminotransferase class I/II-fold pyridoxal phosphate-dependent enzyme [Hymenobacter sediminis]|uniref:pyridoxal phosphate-dependent aminotransferase n=1 Tax=Hymenobacter sediminis TaxID=2218621 RepID=UPI000DA68716|nr:aminotransferase class I/II-fold pyridoxal phosphate-dependent enzyme [Hymenobacter sediminis]RPD47762.1 aminotransferase class I/II-fold pyridoxal phosphate-dependent enzyme [Hymenobacter sediminis]